MSEYNIVFFKTERGERPARDFIISLPEGARGKVAAYLQLLSEKGPLIKREYGAYLRDKAYELRPNFGKLSPRILYFYKKKDIVLTHGFLKKTRTVPDHEIEKAINIMKRYLNR